VLKKIARMKKIKNKLNSGEFLFVESGDHLIKRSFVSSRVSKGADNSKSSTTK